MTVIKTSDCYLKKFFSFFVNMANYTNIDK